MKKVALFFITLLISANLFCQSFEFNDDGNHRFDTTISKLHSMEVWEEVVVLNNSSFELNNISCLIILNDEVEHRLVNISRINIGDDESFDGYEDDELKDELPYYFGKNGKFKANNNSKISFVLDFGRNNNNVIISKIYDKDKNLVLMVTDSEKAVKPDDKIEALGGHVIEVDGKKFLLYGGQAIPVK